MSILDKLNVFLDNTALTASGISDVIDLAPDAAGSQLRNIGGPDAIYWVVQTGATPFTDTGSDATAAFELVSDSTANLATSPTVHASTGTLAFAAMTPNKVLAAVPLPLGDYERYLGVRTTVGAGPFTAGTVKSFLTRDPQFYRAFTANNPQWK